MYTQIIVVFLVILFIYTNGNKNLYITPSYVSPLIGSWSLPGHNNIDYNIKLVGNKLNWQSYNSTYHVPFLAKAAYPTVLVEQSNTLFMASDLQGNTISITVPSQATGIVDTLQVVAYGTTVILHRYNI